MTGGPAERAEELSLLLRDLTAQLGEGMREVQLPLHILLESPFGELNENQEEILQSARDAAASLEVLLRHARQFVELEQGAVEMRVKAVGLAELLRPALAIVEARATRRGVALHSRVSPTAPRAMVDPMHMQEAVTIALGDAVERAARGTDVRIEAGEGAAGRVTVRATGLGESGAPSISMRLAKRLIESQGGTLMETKGEVAIELPAEVLGSGRKA